MYLLFNREYILGIQELIYVLIVFCSKYCNWFDECSSRKKVKPVNQLSPANHILKNSYRFAAFRLLKKVSIFKQSSAEDIFGVKNQLHLLTLIFLTANFLNFHSNFNTMFLFLFLFLYPNKQSKITDQWLAITSVKKSLM